MKYLYWSECPKGGGTLPPFPIGFDKDGRLSLAELTQHVHWSEEDLRRMIVTDGLPVIVADDAEPIPVQEAEPEKELVDEVIDLEENEVDNDLDDEFDYYPEGGEL